jgi:hypothetical protein
MQTRSFPQTRPCQKMQLMGKTNKQKKKKKQTNEKKEDQKTPA